MISVERPHLFVASSTHPGMTGKNNEDRHAVSAFQIGIDQPIPVVFAVVSDGIGGHRAGEVAAGIAVDQITQSIMNSDASHPVEILKEAIRSASNSIHTQSVRDPEKRGMGATCACAWIIGYQLFIAYVGDSRIYLIREGRILQLSKDHTWIQDALDAGLLDTGEAQNHPNAHVIRRYLGSAQPVEPDTRLFLALDETNERAESNQGLTLLPDDQVILCSDGLTDLVNPEEIHATFTSMDQEQALRKSTDLANQRGGHDNITIVALRVPDRDSLAVTTKLAPLKAGRPSRSRRLWKTCLLFLLLLGMIVMLLIGGYFYLNDRLPIGELPTSSDTSLPTLLTPSPSNAPILYSSPTTMVDSPSPASSITTSYGKVSSTVTPNTTWPTNTTSP